MDVWLVCASLGVRSRGPRFESERDRVTVYRSAR